MRRFILIAVAGAALFVTALWLLSGPSPEDAAAVLAASSPASVPTADTRGSPGPVHPSWAGPVSSLAPPPGPLAAVSPAAGPPGAADAFLQGALHRFSFESMPSIDGCLGPVTAPRHPQPVHVRFRRVDAPKTDDRQHYAVAETRLLEGPGETPLAPAAERCVATLRDRRLVLPAGAWGGHQFERVITLWLPQHRVGR